MRIKISYAFGAALLSAALLAGCSSGEEQPEEGTPPMENEESLESSGGGENGSDQDRDQDGDNDGNGDQTGLNIGNTAYVESIIEKYDITLENVRFETEFGEETPEFKDFLIAEFTVENRNDEALDAYEAVNNFELERFSDISKHIDGFEPISGELQPGEKVTGEVIYDAKDQDSQTIQIRAGTAAVGGIDDISWTFERSQVE